MQIVWMIVVGLIVGAIARTLMPGAQPMGWIMTSLLGIGGSFIGGLLGSVLFKSREGNFHPAGWVMSIVGALILLWFAPRFL